MAKYRFRLLVCLYTELNCRDSSDAKTNRAAALGKQNVDQSPLTIARRWCDS